MRKNQEETLTASRAPKSIDQLHQRAAVAMERGDIARAVGCATEAAESALQTNVPLTIVGAASIAAELLLRTGRIREARQVLDAAAPHVEGVDPEHAGRYWALVGRVAERGQRAVAASRAYAQVPVGVAPPLRTTSVVALTSAFETARVPLAQSNADHVRHAEQARQKGDAEAEVFARAALAASLAGEERFVEARRELEQARTLAVGAQAALPYIMSATLLANVEDAAGDRVAAFGTLMRGAVSMVDLLGEGADAPFVDALSRARSAWGEAEYQRVAQSFVAMRKRQLAAARASR